MTRLMGFPSTICADMCKAYTLYEHLGWIAGRVVDKSSNSFSLRVVRGWRSGLMISVGETTKAFFACAFRDKDA